MAEVSHQHHPRKRGHVCSRCRDMPPPAPPETKEEWRARALDAHRRRNDPPPPRDPSWPDFSELYAVNFDVFDSPEKKAFEAWFWARDDHFLWTLTEHHGGRQRETTFEAERAIPPDTKFIASSWTELQRLIEAATLPEVP